jgi:hypothetical protein
VDFHNLSDDVLLRYVRDWKDIWPEPSFSGHQLGFTNYFSEELIRELIKTLCCLRMYLNSHKKKVPCRGRPVFRFAKRAAASQAKSVIQTS